MSCLLYVILTAIFAFCDYVISQFIVWVASKAFGFETNIYQVIFVWVTLIILSIFFSSVRSKEN